MRGEEAVFDGVAVGATVGRRVETLAGGGAPEARVKRLIYQEHAGEQHNQRGEDEVGQPAARPCVGGGDQGAHTHAVGAVDHGHHDEGHHRGIVVIVIVVALARAGAEQHGSGEGHAAEQPAPATPRDEAGRPEDDHQIQQARRERAAQSLQLAEVVVDVDLRGGCVAGWRKQLTHAKEHYQAIAHGGQPGDQPGFALAAPEEEIAADCGHRHHDVDFAEHGEDRPQRKCPPGAPVGCVEGEHQQGHRQGIAVKFEEQRRLRHRVEEIDQRGAAGCGYAVEPTQRHAIGWDGAEGDKCSLGDQQRLWAGPDGQERREGKIDQLDVAGEAAEVAIVAGSDKRLAAQHRENRLSHGAKVEHAAVIAAILEHAERGTGGGDEEHSHQQEWVAAPCSG